MASIENYLISKIIQERSLSEVLDAGVRADHFNSDLGDVYKWIVEHWQEYQQTPSERAFKEEYADFQFSDSSYEPFALLIDELYEAYRNRQLALAVQAAAPALANNHGDEAIRVLTEGLQKAAVEVAHLRDVDIIQNWETRIARYKEMQETPNFLKGIPTGFIGLDHIISGFRNQQLITVVGEAKRGKSLMALIMSITAHEFGLSPLYVSFEMSVQEQEARYDALISKVSHTRIMRGDFSAKEFEKIQQALRLRKNMHPFHMSEDPSSLTTVSAVAAKIQQKRPGIVIIDGVYMMDDEHGEPRGSSQALTNITRGLKRLAQKYDIPIVGTTQVLAWKLGNKRTRQITADSIGYTSSFAQDSDLILGVEADPDIENQAIIRVVLSRTSSKGEVRIKWDWDNMNFTEVGEDEDDNNDHWDY